MHYVFRVTYARANDKSHVEGKSYSIITTRLYMDTKIKSLILQSEVTKILYSLRKFQIILFGKIIITFISVLHYTNFFITSMSPFRDVNNIITIGDPLTAVPNGIYDSSSYLSLLI